MTWILGVRVDFFLIVLVILLILFFAVFLYTRRRGKPPKIDKMAGDDGEH